MTDKIKQCNCDVCKFHRTLPKKSKKELIDIIYEQEFDLQFMEMYKDLCFKFLEKANISFDGGTTKACSDAYELLSAEESKTNDN